MMSEMKADDVRAVVREHYGNIARGGSTGCAPGCCSSVGTAAGTLGYTSDQTGDMIARARDNARKVNATNVEFRLGEIEHLPVADATVDVILSNCVINLSPDKPAVFREAFRVLRAGGRLAISDVVATGPIPIELQNQAAALAGCVAGAAPLDDVRAMLAASGFKDIE